MNTESQNRLLELLAALEGTKVSKKEAMRDFTDTINGIEKQIKDLRLELQAANE